MKNLADEADYEKIDLRNLSLLFFNLIEQKQPACSQSHRESETVLNSARLKNL